MSAADIEQAKRNAAVARARIDSDLGALQQRLNPKTLAQEAWGGVLEKTDSLTDSAVETARRKPALAGGAAAASLLLVFRRPLWRGVRRLFRRRPNVETSTADATPASTPPNGRTQPEPLPPVPPVGPIPPAAAVPAAATTPTGANHGH